MTCKHAIFVLWLLSAPALAVTPWQAEELSKSIASGAWAQSESLCREIMPSLAGEPQEALALKYNLGVSLLNQKKHEEAKSLFETVAKDAADKGLRAKASYNLGNSLFALEKLDEAKKAFEESLLLNSDDDDARYNIEVILRKQQKQKDDQKNQQKQDEKDQNKDKQQQKDQEQKDQDKKEQDDQAKNNQDDGGDKGKDDKPQDGKPDDKDGQGQKQEQDKPSKDAGSDKEQQGQDGQAQNKDGKPEEQDAEAAAMSAAEKKAAEEAQEKARLLEYFRQQERQGHKGVRLRAQPPPPGGKTW